MARSQGKARLRDRMTREAGGGVDIPSVIPQHGRN